MNQKLLKAMRGDTLNGIATVSAPDGKTTGKVVGFKRCTLESCRGTRLGVRWPDGKLTWPCTKGMTNGTSDSNMRIM